jgi:hypothetical protein
MRSLARELLRRRMRKAQTSIAGRDREPFDIRSIDIIPYGIPVYLRNTVAYPHKMKRIELLLLLPLTAAAAAAAPFVSTTATTTTTTTTKSRATTSTSTMAPDASTKSEDDVVTSSHYQAHSADSYEKAYFYEAGAYQHYLVDLIRNRLGLQQQQNQNQQQAQFQQPRHILDIGGGTGNFAQALLLVVEVEEEEEDAGENTSKGGGESAQGHHITVVDPFLDPTATIESSQQQLSFVKESAEIFLTPRTTNTTTTSWRSNVHQVLLKEVVHHLEDRVGIFRGMYNDLQQSPEDSSSPSPFPSLLIVTRPQTEIDYPLWDAARQVWKDHQPSADLLCRELQQAGFTDIQQTLEAYPCQISLTRWQSMIQQRFWSTFSNFSDAELQEACQLIADEYQDRIDSNGILHFEDRLVLITATKK